MNSFCASNQFADLEETDPERKGMLARMRDNFGSWIVSAGDIARKVATDVRTGKVQ